MISNQTDVLSPATIWDAVVIGAGPAGSAIAAQLKRSRENVLLIDRRTLPFHKLCGCCLSPQATTELLKLGIDFRANGVSSEPLERCTFRSSGHSLQYNLSHMAVMSRERLDAQLIEHAMNCGVQYQGGTTIKQIKWEQVEHLRLLRAESSFSTRSDPVTIRARSVIDASGLPSTRRKNRKNKFFAPRIGLGAVLRDDRFPLDKGHLTMLVAPGGYCGVVRLENNCIDIASALDTPTLHERQPWQTIEAIFKHTSN